MFGDFSELDSDYVKLISTQLDYAKSSNLLLFSRDKHSQNLAKKLRAQFGKVFFSTDVKESQKLINSFSNEHQNGQKIDIVLTEYDATSTKLVDLVIRRPFQPETNHCPAIPVVILTNTTNDQDAKNHYLGTSASIKFVKQGAPMKDLFLTMIDILYGCRRVDNLFNDMKKHQLVSSKYTYLPIFESVTISAAAKEDEKEEESVGCGSNKSDVQYQVDEIEDTSECSNLFPEIVEKSPLMKQRREHDAKNRQQLEIENEEALRKKEDAEREEMRRWRETQLRKLEAKLEQVEEEPEELPTETNLMIESKSSINLLESHAARIDSIYLADSHSSSSEGESEEDKDAFDPNRRKPRSEQLLDPKCRPRILKPEELTKKTDVEVRYDLSTFINKPPPEIKRPLTVGGLDKRAAENCWRQIKNPQEERPAERRLSFFSNSFDTGKGGRSSSFLSPIEASSSKKRNHSLIQSTASIDEHVQSTIDKMRLHPGLGNASTDLLRASFRQRRQNSVTTMSAAALSCASWELTDNTKDEKKISYLAKKHPPDYQVSNLLEIDFTSRKINLGEKDMLQRGLKLESQGDLKAAITSYTNAGAHSKDPQISRMLLGNLHYRAGRLMTALKFYSVAIQILETKPEALRVAQDVYLAHHNRAMINFRLGADEEGIEDLQKAAKANPNDISIHELLSLANRRTGKYNEAIDEAIISDTHRQEKKKKELLKAIEDAKLLQRIELGLDRKASNAGLGRGLTGGSGSSQMSESDPLDSSRVGSARNLTSARKESVASGGGEKSKVLNKLPGTRRSSVHQSAMAALAAITGSNSRITMRRVSISDHSISSARSGTARDSSRRTMIEAPGGISSNTAAIAHRRSEYFKNISETKGVVIDIGPSVCQSSLRDRVAEGKRAMKGDGTNLADGDEEGNLLRSFKLQNHLKLELFDELFLKPNPLQEALLVEPHRRAPKQTDVIIDHLKQFAATAKLSLSAMSELAFVMEYRTLSMKESLFEQNDESGALIFLLKGEIELRMDSSLPTHNESSLVTAEGEGEDKAEMKDPSNLETNEEGNTSHRPTSSRTAMTAGSKSIFEIPIGIVPDYSLCGHIDLLFRHPRPQFKKAVEEILLQSIEHSKLWDQSPMNQIQNSQVVTASVSLSHPSNVLNGGSSHGGVPMVVGGGITGPSQTFGGDDGNNNNNNTVNDEVSVSVTGEFDPSRLENETFYKQIQDFMNHWHKYAPTSTTQTFMTDQFKQMNRSIHPGMFMNYTMLSPCELLLVSEKDFQKIFYDQAMEEFLRRLRGIIASGIFKTWKPEELIRLARMGQILTFPNGAAILKQGRKPEYLYIILKGMAKVMKKPNRTEMLLHKLSIAEEKAEQHDLKYVYHHRIAKGGLDSPIHQHPLGALASPPGSPLGGEEEGGLLQIHSTSINPSPIQSRHSSPLNSPTNSQGTSSRHAREEESLPGPLAINTTATTPTRPHTTPSNANSTANTPKATNISTPHRSPSAASNSFPMISARKNTRRQKKLNQAFANEQAMRDFSTSVLMPPTKLTIAEEIRQETEEEIQKLKTLIKKARVLDAMEQKNAYQRRLTRMQQQQQQQRGGTTRQSNNNSVSSPTATNTLTHLGLKQDTRTEEDKIQDLAYTLGNKYAEIRTIQWPMIFGEACILDPENGVSRGLILADTAVEVLAIHKVQFQTFKIDDAFLDRVKGKAVAYPADSDMVVNLYRQQEWKEYRKEVLKQATSSATLSKLNNRKGMSPEKTAKKPTSANTKTIHSTKK